ncbi:MAG: hypothetical protein HY300_08255 [Verrucomicrobia bacterium]|nr:hypothetical protein [Verrucomicrobiota bacterium]
MTDRKNIAFIALALAFTGIAWWIFFAWLRHRSFQKHIGAGPSPGTQHLVLIGSFGALALGIAGFVLILLARSK